MDKNKGKVQEQVEANEISTEAEVEGESPASSIEDLAFFQSRQALFAPGKKIFTKSGPRSCSNITLSPSLGWDVRNAADSEKVMA